MRFTTSADNLAAAVASLKGAIERRCTLPILSHVCMTLEGDTLTLIGTDLERELRTQTPVFPVENGAITVQHERLLALLRALPVAAEVGIRLEGDRLHVDAGRSRFKLQTLPPENFPAFDAGNLGEPALLPAATLARLLAQVSYAMARQDVRYYLNGALIQRDAGLLRVVASDGHRMAVASAAIEFDGLGADWIMPNRSVAELQKILTSGGDVSVRVASNALRFDMAAVQFSTKLIEGRFPDWQRVCPREFGWHFDTDREDLIAALRRVGLTASSSGRGIVLSLTAEGVTLTSDNGEETAEDFVAGVLEGAAVQVCFNVGYLEDALAHLESETVRLSITPSVNSCLVSDPEDDSVRHVVMPMRI